MADLVIQEAYHLLVDVPPLVTGGVHTIASLDEAYHVLTNDGGRLVVLSWHFHTDPFDPPRLPDMGITASFGARASLDVDLPGLEISARTGSRLSKRLPDLGITASATHETLISGSKKLPSMSLSAAVGARCGTLTLADLGLTAEATGGLLGNLSKNLPGLTVSATGSVERTADLSVDLPALTASMSMDAETFVTLDNRLPAMKVSATGNLIVPMSLSATLPDLRISTTGQSGSMTLSGTLPTPIIASIGAGTIMPGGGTVEATDRYDDYVLRHSRW